jgi:uncharacterized protein YfaS (alpha-2-macroglobulin family)
MRGFTAGIAIGAAALLQACGWFGGGPETSGGGDPSGLVGTKLGGAPPPLATFPYDRGSSRAAGPFGREGGLRLLQAFPGEGVADPLQIVAVFDRPMVPLTDLDTMAASVPLACEPSAGLTPRWAGTTTAVLVAPREGLPAATAFTCRVSRRARAVDGEALGVDAVFSFQTPTLAMQPVSPREGEDAFDPAEPLVVRFDQELPADRVASLVTLTSSEGAVPFTVEPVPDTPRSFRLRAALVPDRSYEVTLPAGSLGVEGELPTPEAQAFSFRTYPPLVVQGRGPEGAASAEPWIELAFSTPVAGEQVAAHLALDPAPSGWDPPRSGWTSTRWGHGVALEPDTTYTATLSAGLEDAFGQRLAAPVSWTFTTGDRDPSWAVLDSVKLYPSTFPKELPFRHRNLRQLVVRASAVEPSAVAVPWSDPKVEGPPWRVPVDGERNRSELDVLDLGPLLSPDGFGWVGADFFTPDLEGDDGGAHASGVLVVTDLGATVKLAPGATEVFVTSLSTGEPVPDVQVSMRYSERTDDDDLRPGEEIALGATDARGLLRADGHPDRDWDRWGRPLALILRKGNDRSVVFADWSPGWGWFENDGGEIRSHGFADRGLYRLGDPVHVHATFRSADAGGLSAVAGRATWILRDPDGVEVARGEGALSGDGAFDLRTELPKGGSLGEWTVSVTASDGQRSRSELVSVPVKAYRPASFRVEASGPAAATAGETVTLHADARYLFGAPMRSASVVFRGWAHPEPFAPDGFSGFSFGPETPWWTDASESTASPAIADARPALVDGAASFTVPLTDPHFAEEPFAIELEASVTDVDQQQISASHRVVVLPAAHAVGLRPTSWVAAVGEPASVEIVTVGGDGAVAPGRAVEVQVVRRSFDTVRERGMDGRWRYVTSSDDQPVTTGSARTGADPVRFSFTPTAPGMHVFVARSTDDAGRPVTAEASIYVAGGDASWARAEGKAWLLPDRKDHRPGDTARIVVKGHVPGSWALVTVEREGVLWREALRLEGSSPVVELPIAASWVPGVRVSVAAVTGAGPRDAPDQGRPELVFGTLDLPVDAADRHLAVDLVTAGDTFRPRDTVSVSVAVQRDGAPAPDTAVTLYAVDEGVLSLTGYRTPDAFESMYAPHATNVITLDNRQAVLDRASLLTKGAHPGGGGGLPDTGGPEIRSKFLTTITWQSLRTGPDGRVEATFELPDNLTEFRVMAVAEQADAFGADDEAVRVSRPLVLRSTLPRLLREGDESFAGVVVHNHTNAERSVTVTASSEGPLRVEGSPAVVRVPPEGAVPVAFRLLADEVGEARLTFRGEAGGETDGLVATVPIRRDVRLETVGSAVLVAGSVTERIVAPDGARPGVGGLSVALGTTVLTGADAALDYLVDYPYGCVEQITSQGMGALAVLAVHQRSGSTLPADRLRAVATSVVDRLPRYRAGGGGFGYWPGDERPSLAGTRYALEFLATARRAGLPVDERLVADAAEFLRRHEESWAFDQLPADAQRRARAEIAIGLAAAGQADAGLLSRVHDERDQLSIQHQAELLDALLATSGPDARTAALARSIAARAFVEAEGASIREPHPGGSWGSDDRSTAAVLAAFTRAGDQPLTPRFAAHLADARRADRWHDTRATAAALLALAAYAERYESAASEVDAVVTLAGRELLRARLPVPGTASAEVGLADLVTGPLQVTGERVYLATRLTYAPIRPQPREEGIWVDRRLELVEGGGPDGEVTAGATVRVTLTVATPVERFDVAVRDPFPAGFEVVDTSLATASRSAAEWADAGDDDGWSPRWEEVGGRSFDHHELDDAEVRLFASWLPPGLHTYRYVLRATSPGRYAHPAASAEEMYEPENFGSTAGGTFVVGR